jgi:hypothetical protein
MFGSLFPAPLAQPSGIQFAIDVQATLPWHGRRRRQKNSIMLDPADPSAALCSLSLLQFRTKPLQKSKWRKQ